MSYCRDLLLAPVTYKVKDLGFRVQGIGFGVQDLRHPIVVAYCWHLLHV